MLRDHPIVERRASRESWLAIAWVIAIMGMIFFPESLACTSTDARVAIAGVLSLEQLACAFAQAELGPSEPEAIAALCSIPPALIQDIETILIARERGKMLATRMREQKVAP